MNTRHRLLRQTLTIARRDFIATVFTPTFLIFLLAPIIMMGFGAAMGGIGAAQVAGSGGDKVRLVMIAPAAQADMIHLVDKQLRGIFPRGDDDRPAPLRIESPRGDVATQAHGLFADDEYDVGAVLYGPLDHPQILYGPRQGAGAAYLAQLAEQVLRAERTGGGEPLSKVTKIQITRGQSSFSGRGQVGFLGVFGLFFLTLMLSGQAVGTMAEERSNKVIEVLAAAVPLESVFLGKLLGMFGVALMFVLFWATLLVNLARVVPMDIAHGLSDLSPAVGMPAYPLLFLGYFAMAYMLLGAVFLGVGAQAGTQRELQMMSLPITIFQMGMFGFASAAAASPGSWMAIAAEIFPFSSPFAMIGRAANAPQIWPHLLALAWQVLWVGITITIGARAFRRGVLKSGSPRLGLRRIFAREA